MILIFFFWMATFSMAKTVGELGSREKVIKDLADSKLRFNQRVIQIKQAEILSFNSTNSYCRSAALPKSFQSPRVELAEWCWHVFFLRLGSSRSSSLLEKFFSKRKWVECSWSLRDSWPLLRAESARSLGEIMYSSDKRIAFNATQSG